nr:MAG TPA: hypothetical protein [Caudoviricetes sp.]
MPSEIMWGGIVTIFNTSAGLLRIFITCWLCINIA